MAVYKKVRSVQELMLQAIKMIERDRDEVIESVAEDIKNILFLYTENWYNNHEPEQYERTYEFIHSLKISNLYTENNVRYIEVGFDPKDLTMGDNNGFRQHEDAFVPLSSIIDSGWTIMPSGKQIKGSNALTETIKYMESSGFLNNLKEEFKNRGYYIV